MNELFDRWAAKTPVFWRKVRTYAITLAASATAIWTINSTMVLGLDEWILTGCKYAIAIGAAVGVSAQLTKE